MNWVGSIFLGILGSSQMQSFLRTALKAGGGWLVAQGLNANDVNTLVAGASAVIIGLINSAVAHTAPAPPAAPSTPTPASLVAAGYQPGELRQLLRTTET